MAIPLYIVCSRGASADRESGLYSVFEIIEKVILTQFSSLPVSGGAIIVERESFIITSSWMIDIKNGESYDDEFELACKVHMENGDTLLDKQQNFKFGGPATPAHRFSIRLIGPMPIQHSGILVAECRVRKIGTSNWKSHNYRVIVEVQKVEEAKKEEK